MENQVDTQKVCFVIMGFGTKTDYQTGRVLDLDKTYRAIIEPAVKAAGLRCVRADDYVHSGVIDKPMYEFLCGADLVVADLSTSNLNAIYELGVRHALRPHRTIVLAEREFKFPFDLKSLNISRYEHLGKGIDYEEAERLQEQLTGMIHALFERVAEVDSPVYTFLPDLADTPHLVKTVETRTADAAVQTALPGASEATTLLERYRVARTKDDFTTAKALAQELCVRLPGDPYPIQQHALMTYKSEHPTRHAALLEARAELQRLAPEHSLDPETLGLWGAIHKRLWEITHKPADLDEAIQAYARGFLLRNDSYNGINYAFLLNVRAQGSQLAEAIADFVLAQRVRRQVMEICRKELEAEPRTKTGHPDVEQRFWLEATLLEARLGLGEQGLAQGLAEERARLVKAAPAGWMAASMEAQLDSLAALLTDAPTRHLPS
ncbi:MAG TPA: TRAFs-binding domain-containing protein [Kofleriaceae bacterium]